MNIHSHEDTSKSLCKMEVKDKVIILQNSVHTRHLSEIQDKFIIKILCIDFNNFAQK